MLWGIISLVLGWSGNFVIHARTLNIQSFELTSPAFPNDHWIPTIYTCQGKGISPPLKWRYVPKGTKSFSLICEDLDAPGWIFFHWIIYNISGSLRSLPKNISRISPLGFEQGINSFGYIGFGPFCPPNGVHRYKFLLYALNGFLKLKSGISAKHLQAVLQGHILGKAELMGLYKGQ